mgnify:CR=1 FL=1
MDAEQVFFNVPLARLEPIFKRWIKEAQLELNQENPKQEKPTTYIPRIEAAKKLQITVSTLDKYTKAGLLQSYRRGGRIYYKSNDLDKLFDAVKNAKYKRG